VEGHVWQSLELVLAVGAAVVFATAGALKLLGRVSWPLRALAGTELLVAALIVFEPLRPVGAGLGCVLGIGFVGHAILRGDRPCRCFGRHLEPTSRRARLARALGALGLCAGVVTAWVTATPGNGDYVLSSSVLGIVLGLVVITAPAVPSLTEAEIQ
jgi:uncharacterized membrane protein HdeD (DUF308 family)